MTLSPTSWPGGGAAQPITRGDYLVSDLAVAPDVPTKLAFTFDYGDALLDLADSANPTPVASGTYAFAVNVLMDNPAFATVPWFVEVTLDNDDFGVVMGDNKVATVANGGSLRSAVTLPFYVPAGSPCFVTVRHSDSAAVRFSGRAHVQRLS